jgi:DNA repair protein RadC
VIYTARRPSPISLSNVLRAPRAVRVFLEARRPTADEVDSAWLKRVELRSLADVANHLDGTGFCDRPGLLTALFVDNRCGLIQSHPVGRASDVNVDATVRCILRLASDCHASGLILVTHDLSGRIARTRRCRELTMTLHRKGELIEIFLLNHLVFTAQGWKRMIAIRNEDRI